MGKVMMSGVAPQMKAPITSILASDLAVGSVVKLMENGVATEYIVVNHGKPGGSSLYDDSCYGTWLLRKDIKEKRQWNSSNVDDYKNSTIHSWLNGDFYNQFGSIEKTVIKQVKIPYVNGNGNSGPVNSGTNGLSTKTFLLGCYEVGYTTDYGDFPVDGAKLDYFISGNDDIAKNKRIGYMDGSAIHWWFRSPRTSDATDAWMVTSIGNQNGVYCSASYGIRPALVIPSNSVFDTNTLILKGVA